MNQQSRTSGVTVEYYDPHHVFNLFAPGLSSRLPLRNLHWQSHVGPIRSIDTLHIELVRGDTVREEALGEDRSRRRDDGYQAQRPGSSARSAKPFDSSLAPSSLIGNHRRHQIPGLRRTPFLKILLIRCDDTDSYKNSVRGEVREWIKSQVPPSASTKKFNHQEKHDAFEWLIVHVVPNTAAAAQPRSSNKTENDAVSEKSLPASRRRAGTLSLLEKLRSDFNVSSKGSLDRIVQVRPAVQKPYNETLSRTTEAAPPKRLKLEVEQDTEDAWDELTAKLKSLILSCFDQRVTHYEEDIKEKDGQRSLPGWNFCTFFILKEGLAQGFESVGLVEDALVVYDELSLGLESVTRETHGTSDQRGGTLLSFSDELKSIATRAFAIASGASDTIEAAQSPADVSLDTGFGTMPISCSRKPYRELILSSQVSPFDFRCYIFSRQASLLLKLGHGNLAHQESDARLLDQRGLLSRGPSDNAVISSVPGTVTAPSGGPEKQMALADLCQRTLEFIPSVSCMIRRECESVFIYDGHNRFNGGKSPALSALQSEVLENIVISFAFSVAQQMLVQTSTNALHNLRFSSTDLKVQERSSSVSDRKSLSHPARFSSLGISSLPRTPPSPSFLLDSGSFTQKQSMTSLDQLAGRHADLYLLSRDLLYRLAKTRGWQSGWDEASALFTDPLSGMDDIRLDDEKGDTSTTSSPPCGRQIQTSPFSDTGIENDELRASLKDRHNFHTLFTTLTDAALRHFTIANHIHAARSCLTDLAVLKFHLKELKAATVYFNQIIPFMSEKGWSLLELCLLSMFSECLTALDMKEEYVDVALRLLACACAMAQEQSWTSHALSDCLGTTLKVDISSFQGVLEKVLTETKNSKEYKEPLANYFSYIHLTDTPEYHPEYDLCTLAIRMFSLLPGEILVDSAEVAIRSVDGISCDELIFGKSENLIIRPGENVVRVDCNHIVPGTYRLCSLRIRCSNLQLHFQRDTNQDSSNTTDFLRDIDIRLFQRTDALDASLVASKDICLDRSSSLILTVTTGWNMVKNCQVRVRPSTGGLRLLTTEAQILDSSHAFLKPPEAGIFAFGALSRQTSIPVQFPYSIEQDVADISAVVEIPYVTTSGKAFEFIKSLNVPIALVIGVSEQDIFKREIMFTRFNVSCVGISPLRLIQSELHDSDTFESESGVSAPNDLMIFPRQPASLLFRIGRKTANDHRPSERQLQLKLRYSVLLAEIENLIQYSLMEALRNSSIWQFAKLVVSLITCELKKYLQAQDLERAALEGQVTTTSLQTVAWGLQLEDLGLVPGTGEAVQIRLCAFILDWLGQNEHIKLVPMSQEDAWTICIPVDIPSVPIVHTADLRLGPKLDHSISEPRSGAPMLSVKVIPARLQLKWTRLWETASEVQQLEGREFSYEVTSPSDAWLVGGRRKGHFVIPAAVPSTGHRCSTESESDIPLVLLAQHKGWLPLPTVEVREIVRTAESSWTQGCEVDLRSAGETVQALHARKAITISLDESGPQGGPLVLANEEAARSSCRVIS